MFGIDYITNLIGDVWMTAEAAILETTRRLPASVKQSVLLYAQFLANRYAKETASEPKKKEAEATPDLSESLKELLFYLYQIISINHSKALRNICIVSEGNL